VFALCVVFVGVMFKLFSPRIGHLANSKLHPPAWVAALLAWILVAVVDLLGGLDPDGYRASVWEWLGYAGGSFLVASFHFGLLAEVACSLWNSKQLPAQPTESITLEEIKTAPWDEINEWLQSDASAQYDFIGNQSVAHRVSIRISEGTRSVGIVGPYGAGKTSIVNWVTNRLKRHEVDDRKYFVCHHSCWGFETSATAIHDMLASAVSKLGAEIDTFQVDSLPEAYRKTFSAGGNWVESISNLVLLDPDPIEQFSRLSDLLQSIGGRLVFIVEDLDRNESRNFEIQEVLAFLTRLKEYSRINFILTGGVSSSPFIDYSKLCDHIEFLRTIQPQHSSKLIERVRQRCLDNTMFPHTRLADPSRNYEWNPLSQTLVREYEELSLAQAVALLLNTPRSLRHALGRTFSAWQTLHGEIDFNDLLAVNVLRFGAPECFQFVMRRWDRLHSLPSNRPAYGQERISGIRQSILDDWNLMIQRVTWNPTAALHVLKFILPATEHWLVDNSRRGHSQSGQQHVDEERYWIRAINEAIDEDDVRDQEVIRDIQAWMATPDAATELVTKLTSLPKYADVWEYIAGGFFGNRRDECLRLCEQVIHRILSEQGSLASADSQGFVHTWRFAASRAFGDPANREWLETLISNAAGTSLEMVNALWHYYGNPGRHSILNHGDGGSVRQHTLNAVRANVVDRGLLTEILSSSVRWTLRQLVFDPGDSGERILVDVESWAWLGRPLLEAIRNRNVTAAINCAALLSSQTAGTQLAINSEMLNSFFGSSVNEVIEILDEIVDQLPEEERVFVRNIVLAARQQPDNNQESDADAT